MTTEKNTSLSSSANEPLEIDIAEKLYIIIVLQFAKKNAELLLSFAINVLWLFVELER